MQDTAHNDSDAPIFRRKLDYGWIDRLLFCFQLVDQRTYRKERNNNVVWAVVDRSCDNQVRADDQIVMAGKRKENDRLYRSIQDLINETNRLFYHIEAVRLYLYTKIQCFHNG